MRALILAAGLGTRLKPLTNQLPKVMVNIAGKPLLLYHLQSLKKSGCKNIWINLHHFPDSIKSYFGDGTKFGVKITYSFEEKLLGTAGALKNPKSRIEKEFRKGRFLVVYGDNLIDFDYSKLIKFHQAKKSFLTLAVYHSDEPWTKGVIKTNQQRRVLDFIEKPAQDAIISHQVNGGIYLCQPEVLDYIPPSFSDFGCDIFPKLIKENLPLYALKPDYYFQDVGTQKGLEKARRDLKIGKLNLD